MVALPGVDPAWSTYSDVPSTSAADNPGTVNSWHYLDNGPQLSEAGTAVRGTLLCVHGNPTWSYLWRTLLARGVSEGWRVVAVDQLDMGFSRRTRTFRRLADRVTDLEDFAAALSLEGPLVTVGHDWGGVVSLGYAHRNRSHLAGVVLTNTAIHQEPKQPIPSLLRLALLPGMHRLGTQTTSAFLDVTHALARPKLPRDVHAAFRAPYRTRADRAGIANFVSDIPAAPSHPSYATLTGIAEGIRTLDVPSLMVWGPRDPIFTDTYLEDLTRRLPSADVHRFEDAGHLLQEDADVAGTIFSWLDERFPPASREGTASTPPLATPSHTFLWHHLQERSTGAEQGSLAVAEMGRNGIRRSLSWRELADDVAAVAAGLAGLGVGSESRVSLMVPPGVDLTVLIYACLRIGAIIVVADAGLGTKGLSRAVKGSVPDVVIGIERALLAARLFGWPGRRISVGTLAGGKRALRVESSLETLRTTPPGTFENPDPDADAAILFTSGSTGPAKGVVYTHRQLSGMRDTVGGTFGLGPGGALVAGFAPFALLGPALGGASVTPDMEVTAPRTLTAQALADAARAIDATAVFAAPAALRNLVATKDNLTPSGTEALGKVTTVLSAGAPVPALLLEQVQELLPAASLHTPYGMTEALPVSNIDLEGIRAAEADAAGTMPGAGNGVCVGRAVQGARLAVSALSDDGVPDGTPTTEPGVTGEILVDAPHVKSRYYRLWRTEGASSRTAPWHRTGDVGHFDGAGRLWVEGRLGHIITTPGAVLTPVGLEQALEKLEGVRLAAVVGVGPTGTQAIVAVVEPVPAPGRNRRRSRKPVLADSVLTERARNMARTAGIELAAVLTVPGLPVDIRHNAKIDRTEVAKWAGAVLAGSGSRIP
ncbi:acyl-coenzyme A synthetase/AMP-(fatty) acid ligase/pimeloyl-ACP methyl ester carboxylesterase [Arthrobacter sp. CAN_A214]|uniref:alpha/beta fold hydrolase n=1 Tax=Arthrobacter sp. CAN_A214 TaxID=2787720 RepID=UPI0018CBCD86